MDADWGHMQWLVEDATHPGADLSLAKMTVLPGKTSPAHIHANAIEVIHVLSGDMSARVGDNWVSAKAGDTVFVPANTVHQTQCLSGEPAIMMIAYSTGRRDYEEQDT